MRAALAILLLVAQSALADVTIEVWRETQGDCNKESPGLLKNNDGSYTYPMVQSITLMHCPTHEKSIELWTDYPEKGGKLIRRVIDNRVRQ